MRVLLLDDFLVSSVTSERLGLLSDSLRSFDLETLRPVRIVEQRAGYTVVFADATAGLLEVSDEELYALQDHFKTLSGPDNARMVQKLAIAERRINDVRSSCPEIVPIRRLV